MSDDQQPGRQMFRSRALSGQHSGDELDVRVRIVSTPAWVALALAIIALVGFGIWLFLGTVAVTVGGSGVVINAPTNVRLTSSATGVVSKAPPAIGTAVRAGQVVAVVAELVGGDSQEAVSQIVVTAPMAGVVVAVGPGLGATVDFADYLATLAPLGTGQMAYIYVSVEQGEQLESGMSVLLSPDSVDPSSQGQLLGVISSVSPLPVTESRIAYTTADPALGAALAANGSRVEVQVALRRDRQTPTGLAWTRRNGPTRSLTSGVPTAARIVLAQVRPYEAFFGSWE